LENLVLAVLNWLLLLLRLYSFRKQLKFTNITFFSLIDTNLIHNFLYKLHKSKFLYMFRASSAHLQEVIDLLKMGG